MALGSHASSELQAEERSRPGEPRRADAEMPLEAAAEPATVSNASQTPGQSVAPVWLQRVSLVMLVMFCVYLGILVAILPWWTRIWDQNMFINAHPALAAVLHSGAVRGLISGLGLVDIWIGISEAIHYRDHRP